MFFIFSKLLLILFVPLNWILAAFITALITKRPKKKRLFFKIAFILLVVFTNPYLLDVIGSSWNIKNGALANNKTYSCVIVLGGFASEGAKGVGYFNGASDRFIQGFKLLSVHKAAHILISGGNGGIVNDGFRESDWVKNQLRLFNVPDSSIIVEDNSRNTLENAAFSKLILQKGKLQPPFILVTSAFHMRRSLGVFKKADIDVIPYSCNFLTGGKTFAFLKLVPDANVLSTWNIYIKEFVGTVVYKLIS